jgi:hypothetical protein
MTDQGDAEFFEILARELRQQVRLYGVFAKSRLVLLQAETAQPTREVHVASFARCIRRAYNPTSDQTRRIVRGDGVTELTRAAVSFRIRRAIKGQPESVRPKEVV